MHGGLRDRVVGSCALANLCYPPQNKSLKHATVDNETIERWKRGQQDLTIVHTMDLLKYDKFLDPNGKLPEFVRSSLVGVKIHPHKPFWPQNAKLQVQTC